MAQKAMRPETRAPPPMRRQAGSSAPLPATSRLASHVGDPAEVGPRREQRIETLASIAERADEQDDWPRRDRNPSASFAARLDRRTVKAIGVDAVIDTADAAGCDADAGHDILDRARAVADDEPGAGQRAALRRDVPAMFRRDQEGVQRAGCCRLVCGMHVMHPRDIAGVDVAAVGHDRAAGRADARGPAGWRVRVSSGSPRLFGPEGTRHMVHAHRSLR